MLYRPVVRIVVGYCCPILVRNLMVLLLSTLCPWDLKTRHRLLS
jgi:hypothetical protein